MNDNQLKNNFVSIPPLNENYEENLKAFEKLFRKEISIENVPQDAEIMAIDNLVFLHKKILPIPVYVELKTEKRSWTRLQQTLLQYFIKGWVIQIRPMTLKTIPNHGQMFLGVICMVPYFKISTIATDASGCFDIDKSDIKYVFCRGTQLLALFQDNVCSILNISHKDPLMPKRRNCRHYTDLNVFHQYSLRMLLSGLCGGISRTIIEMPWITIDRNAIELRVKENRNAAEMSRLHHIWPTKRIVCPINDKIWEKPHLSPSSGESVSLYCISTIKDNVIKTSSTVFNAIETTPFWASPKPPKIPDAPILKPTPKRTPKKTRIILPKLKKPIADKSQTPETPDKADEIPFTVEREFSL